MTTLTSRPLVLGWLLVVVVDERFADAQWVRKPSEELLERTPGLIHETFESASMKTTVGYSVVLPPSYESGERTKSQFILDILERNLNSDPELICQNNTYHYLEKNQAVLRRGGTRILLICGEDDSWKNSAVSFQAALQERNIPCELKLVPDTGHSLRGVYGQEGAAAAIFQDQVFRQALSKAPDASRESISTIDEAYFSPAEGQMQQFQVVLPPGYSPEVEYPLIVQVFGSASLLPTRERPFVRVRPSGRGVWGYRSMSRYDVMRVIRRTKTAYRIDEDRVYMTGTSAGATGMMHTAAHRQDVFAGLVPLVAFGNDLPLENFRNLPIRCEHGVNDWTSAIGNVRVQFQKLRDMGYDAVLNEHPTAGHGIRAPPQKTMEWLFSLRRDSSPRHITYTCEHPRDGRIYWLKIEKFLDPHQVTRIEAKAGEGGLKITTENVRQFSIDPSAAPLRPGQKITVDGMLVKYSHEAGQKRLTIIRNGDWQMASPRSHTTVRRRTYGAGAAANLFQGEPLLVIYGTGADNAFLQRAAKVLSRTGGPVFKPANVRFPVRADSDLGDVPLEKYNLLLVGTRQNNSYLRKIAARLPYRIENGVLNAGGREPLSLGGSVLGFFYFNPEHPTRVIYVVSPYLNEVEQERFLENPRHFLAGSPGFKMIDQPDLLVRRADLRIRREMQLDADWKFIRMKGEEKRIPDRFSDRLHLAMAHMKLMQRTAEVDFAFWWGPEDRGLFGGYDFNWLSTFDPEFYTMADYAVRRRETESMTAVLSGAEFCDIFDRWIATGEVVSWPAVKKEDLDVNGRYSIVIPMDLVPKLGNRKKVLSTVAPGPAIMPDQVAGEIFGPSD